METPGLELSGSCSESNSSIFEPFVQLQVLQSPVGGEKGQRRKAPEQQPVSWKASRARWRGPAEGRIPSWGFPHSLSPRGALAAASGKPCRLWQVCGVTLELDPKPYPEGAEAILLSQGCLGTECPQEENVLQEASSAAVMTGCSPGEKSPPEFHCVTVWNLGSLVSTRTGSLSASSLSHPVLAQKLCVCVCRVYSLIKPGGTLPSAAEFSPQVGKVIAALCCFFISAFEPTRTLGLRSGCHLGLSVRKALWCSSKVGCIDQPRSLEFLSSPPSKDQGAP